FFANPVNPGASQGQTYLGFRDVTTNAAGVVFFAIKVPPVPLSNFVTATATDAAGNTSEFSPGLKATAALPRLFAVGADAGDTPTVKVYNADGSPRFDFLAYDPAFTGGVRVATAGVD